MSGIIPDAGVSRRAVLAGGAAATAALALPSVTLAADGAGFPALAAVSSASPAEDPAYLRQVIAAVAAALAASGADLARTWVLVDA